jgi:D-serine deaminase-like pyridoxal phosphate-dependent protein
VSPDATETPAAVVDADRLETNLARWQAYCDRHGLANRPHVKTHRCVEIAHRQLSLGSVGITCQKLSEAETMANAGCDDILVPFNIVGDIKLERLRRLLERVTLSVSVDDAALLPGLAEAASGAHRELGVLVDCDTGLGRTGVTTPDAAVDLAAAVAGHDGLRFDGFLTYPASQEGRYFLATAVAGAARRGLDTAVVSAGGTASMWESAELLPTVTEYRVGLYVFHDRMSIAAGAATIDDAALTVHATVVSRPAPDRAVLDAGSKALTSDLGPDPGYGLVLDAPRSTIVKLAEEHAYVELAPGDRLELGQRVRIVPNHACVVVNLYDQLVVTRDGQVEATWRVAARGRSQKPVMYRWGPVAKTKVIAL